MQRINRNPFFLKTGSLPVWEHILAIGFIHRNPFFLKTGSLPNNSDEEVDEEKVNLSQSLFLKNRVLTEKFKSSDVRIEIAGSQSLFLKNRVLTGKNNETIAHYRGRHRNPFFLKTGSLPENRMKRRQEAERIAIPFS